MLASGGRGRPLPTTTGQPPARRDRPLRLREDIAFRVRGATVRSSVIGDEHSRRAPRPPVGRLDRPAVGPAGGRGHRPARRLRQHGPGGGPDQQPTPWDMSWATDDEPAEPTDAESADSDAPAGSGAHSGADRPDPLTDPLGDAKRTSPARARGRSGPRRLRARARGADRSRSGGPPAVGAGGEPADRRGPPQQPGRARYEIPSSPIPVVADPAIAAAMQTGFAGGTARPPGPLAAVPCRSTAGASAPTT
jgi:hypothetical protein